VQFLKRNFWLICFLSSLDLLYQCSFLSWHIILSKAPAKKLQHFSATYRNIVGPVFASPGQMIAAYRNIVGRNMLCLFGHLVAMCCDMLGVVGSSLKLLKFFMQHLRMLHDVYSFGQVRGTILRQSMRTSSICSTQHVVTRRNRVVKRTQYVAPAVLRYVALNCFDRLAGA